MANLKDLLVNGPSNLIGDVTVNKIRLTSLEVNNGTNYDPGSNGQVLKSNGTSVYWANDNITITANATDGLWDLTGTNGTNSVTYALTPYSSKQTVASFYTGTTNPTFYRYYAQIISRLKTIQPKAKFFLFTLTWLYTETPPYDAWVDRVNEAIKYIGEHNENCYVIDLDADRWYYGTDVTGNRRSGHYNAIGYNMQAMHLAKLIGKYIHDHQSEFRQVEFIGTDLAWNN